MKKILTTAAVLSLALSLGACSSTKKAESSGDEIPSTTEAKDAGTDAVPQATAEIPPPADSNATAPVSPASETAKNDSALPVVPNNTETTSTGPTENYTVQTGETLMQIAFENYGDLYKWKDIYEANKDVVKNPNRIPGGTILKLEKPSTPVNVSHNGEKYLIKIGDTLGTISTDVYGTKTKWKRIYENNKELIHDPNRIFAGFFVYYTMSPQDRQEMEKFKDMKAPAPLAAAPVQGDAVSAVTTPTTQATTTASAATAADTSRAPASATAGGDVKVNANGIPTLGDVTPNAQTAVQTQ